ncbi:MAG: uracil-DNA glycosylase [Magnetococcales bacterium]|nr:uracil-DNA glycosylase [Magnetococcales bacterium]
MNRSAEERGGGIDCQRCRHFHVTWDPQFPRGCRAMGFKTSQWPWMEVLRSSGEPCLNFQEKAKEESARPTGSAGDNPPTTRGFSRLA